jgi:hypothetical protein
MQHSYDRPICHRAEDLVTYLYGEASEADALEFRHHLAECDACRTELTIFNQVHDSILTWRDQTIGASAQVSVGAQVVARPIISHQERVSALAAIRQFFNMSPLWLRGATAFAGLLLCALVVFAVSRVWQRPLQVTKTGGEPRIFTQSDLDKAVAETRRELNARQSENSDGPKPESQVVQQTRAVQRSSNPSKAKPGIKALTRQEREQLASDLRLISASDDEDTTLALPDADHPN